MMSTEEIPLFPLNTVLFPDGVLALRIFETRYLDMVSGCLKQNSGFAVVSIAEGQEAGGMASFSDTGTVARIVDFDRLDDGFLGITCQGEQRLRVLSQRVRPDQLLLGRVDRLPPDPLAAPLPNHRALSELLRNILDREEIQPYTRFLTPAWDNAAWIGNRLAEILPLPIKAKQMLLAMSDPLQRLDVLHLFLQDQKSV